jgi:hypothetical protein
MTETSKAIGLRLPIDVWGRVREYGVERYPSEKSKEKIDVTQTIVSLLKQALDIPLDINAKLPNNILDERITDIVRQQITEISNTMSDESITKLERQTEAIEGLKEELADVSEFTRNLQGEIAEVKKAMSVSAASPTSIDKPDRAEMKLLEGKLSIDSEPETGNTKTWGEFFKMVGIEALAAVEAQKKENTSTRTKQIEMGLQAARDMGLGEWAVKVAGRSFVRITPPHTS